MPDLPRLIAFYLPQYHPIPENDRWWGKGFTEWRNVARGVPMFKGHHQPQLPADLGFYDLRVPDVREEQAALARTHGIAGFCYYYYSFAGRRVLDLPLREVLASGRPDFPFCICWANESWSRRWDGGDNDIIIPQKHSLLADARFIDEVLPILSDPRYITVDGKPLLLVYRPEIMHDAEAASQVWRRRAVEAGLPGLHLANVQSFARTDPRDLGFDAAVEFPPQQAVLEDVRQQVEQLRLDFDGSIFDYRHVMEHFLRRPLPEYPLYRGVMPAWDNTARRLAQAQIIHNSHPDSYRYWLSSLVRESMQAKKQDDLIFVNAWNEWAEGCHLEPDLRDGHAYLRATREAIDVALRDPRPVRMVDPGPLVSVVIPSYNHARFIRQAIQSVDRQTYKNIELVVVDDGSHDESCRTIEATLKDVSLRRVIFRPQHNLGAAATIDRGIMLSSGEYVAVLNSDDFFHERRIAQLMREVTSATDALVFSTITVVDDASEPLSSTFSDPRLSWYRQAVELANLCPTAGFALLASSLTVSTSNFLFSRALFEKLQGFHPHLRLSHDWDFVLRALFYCEPRFVPEPLLSYRLHSSNAHSSLSDVRRTEGELAIQRYVDQFTTSPVNPLAPTPGNWPAFFPDFVSYISPWFAREPLATFIQAARPGPGFFEPAGARVKVSPAAQRRAVAALRDTLNRSDQEPLALGILAERIAARWASSHPEAPVGAARATPSAGPALEPEPYTVATGGPGRRAARARADRGRR